jgi:tetratricopeptide (TPR) repeat protein
VGVTRKAATPVAPPAARFWIGMQLALRGQMGPATGWLGRAHRLLEGEAECVEHAYLQMPVAFQRRAREWTDALARWCEDQTDLLAFTGRCSVHRAEILRLQGAWHDALAEAARADRRSQAVANQAAVARAAYLCGEVRRLQGELAEAERAYRRASGLGLEPQPGWALLRLAQGKTAARPRPSGAPRGDHRPAEEGEPAASGCRDHDRRRRAGGGTRRL